MSQEERIKVLLRVRPMMQPFQNSTYSRCVKISLCDLHLLTERNRSCSANSFLCHSYYRYRHMLLAVEKKQESETFWLLVPGVSCAREKNMAELYGFPEFIPIRRNNNSSHAFGYWRTKVEQLFQPSN